MTLSTELRTSQFGRPPAVAPRQEVVNCFSINGTGKIVEGIELETAHPVSNGQPVLFIGERYIVSHDEMGVTTDADGIVRQAMVTFIPSPNTNGVPVLVRPQHKPNPLLYVDTSPAPGVKPKERFWCGTVGGKSILRNGPCALVSVRPDDVLYIFYMDGTVRCVTQVRHELAVEGLTFDQQAELRIDRAIQNINYLSQEKDIDDDERAKRLDHNYHQLAAIIAVGGRRSDAVLTSAFEPLLEAAEAGKLRQGVRDHVIIALRPFPAQLLKFDSVYEVVRSKKSSGGAFGDVVAKTEDVAPSTRKGPPAERKAYVAERAERRALNSPSKGKTGNTDSSKGPTNPKSIRRRQKALAKAAAKRKH